MNVFIKTLDLSTRLILAGIFIYASFDKIIHPKEMALIIYNYRILPDIFIGFAALILPFLELFVGIFILTRRFRQAAALLISGLTMTFASAVGYNLYRGLDFSCGCFSSSLGTGLTGYQTLGLELVLFVMAVYTLIRGYYQSKFFKAW